jgi:hypothetical protein
LIEEVCSFFFVYESRFTEQLILFALVKTPSTFAPIIQERSSIFRDFFSFDVHRISAWFSFKFSGKNEFGALALEQYLFMYRDAVWPSLSWQGRRDVPPCIAIQKRNMLLELDLVKTINQLAEEEPLDRPNFFESDFFKQSLASGAFLEMEYPLHCEL